MRLYSDSDLAAEKTPPRAPLPCAVPQRTRHPCRESTHTHTKIKEELLRKINDFFKKN